MINTKNKLKLYSQEVNMGFTDQCNKNINRGIRFILPYSVILSYFPKLDKPVRLPCFCKILLLDSTPHSEEMPKVHENFAVDFQ